MLGLVSEIYLYKMRKKSEAALKKLGRHLSSQLSSMQDCARIAYIYKYIDLKCLGNEILCLENDAAKNANTTSRKCDGLDSIGFLSVLF